MLIDDFCGGGCGVSTAATPCDSRKGMSAGSKNERTISESTDHPPLIVKKIKGKQ